MLCFVLPIFNRVIMDGHPISYRDTIEDGQNKTSHRLYSLNRFCQMSRGSSGAYRMGVLSVVLNDLVFFGIADIGKTTLCVNFRMVIHRSHLC